MIKNAGTLSSISLRGTGHTQLFLYHHLVVVIRDYEVKSWEAIELILNIY